MSTILRRLDQVMLFRQTLTTETDRGVGLVCAAFLAEELRALLEKTFADVPNTMRKLFEGTGPLATFSSRIDLALATGSLSVDSHRALHLIRKIRNSFAHEHKERSFIDEDISTQCRELISLNPFIDEKDPRKLYIRAVLTVLAQIHSRIETTQHVGTARSKTLHTLRSSFEKVRDTLDVLMANLTEEQISRLSSPETKVIEKKHLVLEALMQAGVNLPEEELD